MCVCVGVGGWVENFQPHLCLAGLAARAAGRHGDLGMRLLAARRDARVCAYLFFFFSGLFAARCWILTPYGWVRGGFPCHVLELFSRPALFLAFDRPHGAAAGCLFVACLLFRSRVGHVTAWESLLVVFSLLPFGSFFWALPLRWAAYCHRCVLRGGDA
ncbi:hypothetical protein BDY21DRAFT_142229 [Lineolata rhizophorae]|uniref:Uncharacterized protein n=1 Tax=Lineolata rhizophorae TaxID=578093 RepID=A0A6A6NN37_9PEZI|nr:hypothetical protein BDY21DRAFT_142229 [Lineolata rhizophorae]